MIVHDYMPEDLDLYCAQLDVLTVRIETMKAQQRGDRRVCAGVPFRRLKRIERQCRSLRRLLLRWQRSGTRLHGRIRVVLEQARGSFSEPAGQPGFCPGTKKTHDGTIRVETVEPDVILTALPPSTRQQRIQTSK